METTIGRIFMQWEKCNVVMWKNREYEYILSAWNKREINNNKEITIYAII